LAQLSNLTGLSSLEQALAPNIIMTDDPMRTKMLAAHYLENSEIIYELRGLVGYNGSYKDENISLVSTGYGESSALLHLYDAMILGAKRIVYMGECISTTADVGLRDVILSDSGDKLLIEQTLASARVLAIDVSKRKVLTNDRFPLLNESLMGDIIDFASASIATFAALNQIALVAILTVTRNLATGESLEEHERQSRMNNAARLAFETLASRE